MPDFLLPDLGEGLTEAHLITWLVAVGDEVAIDQPVAEVETAKAAVEVPVPFAGRVTSLHAAAGDVVQVGCPLVTVDVATGTSATGTPAAGPGERERSGAVLIGYGTSEPTRRKRVRGKDSRRIAGRSAADGATSDAMANDAVADDAVANEVGVPDRPESDRTAVISPLVRRLARERGVDVAQLRGTGPDGIVLRRDIPQSSTAPPSTPSPTDPPPANPPTTRPSTAGRRIPLVGVRRAMAESVTRSRREIPEATVWVDVDATEFVAACRTLGIGRLALLSRFVVLGLRRYPELNSWVEPDAVVLSDAINIGLAAQTDRGLVVPVIRDAQSMTTAQLAAAIGDLTIRARAGTLTPRDLTGGTVTVNNYGVFGVDGSAAIINSPQAAIVGLGRIIDRPWVVEGELAIRKVAEVTLAFDHRACDGGTAGGFLRFLADCIEVPLRALIDL